MKDDLNTDVKVVALLYSLALHGHFLHSWYKLNTNFLENETFSYELTLIILIKYIMEYNFIRV